MPFKVKDLMIDVAGESKLQFCRFGTQWPCIRCTRQITQICQPCTPLHDTGIACKYNTYGCGGLTDCGMSDDPRTPEYTETIIEYTRVAVAEQIPALKQQLQTALQLIEQREITVNEQLQPQTVEEVNMLESKLTEALDHLKSRKAELQKKK